MIHRKGPTQRSLGKAMVGEGISVELVSLQGKRRQFDATWRRHLGKFDHDLTATLLEMVLFNAFYREIIPNGLNSAR